MSNGHNPETASAQRLRDLLHRQECDPFHGKAGTVRAITAPREYGEQARRRKPIQAEPQTRTRGGNGARSRRFPRHPFPVRSVSSSRHYPEKHGITLGARRAPVAP